jgi:glycosyltransferase involved in cell wall biosynthesis
VSTDFSVVVCAHDEARWEELNSALRSVAEQTLEPHQVIVVVDRNEVLLRRIRESLDVVAIPNTQTPGLGGARNSGVAASSGQIVVFLDDDAIAPRDWLALFAEQYSDPAVAGVGGSAEPLWSDARPRWFPPEFDWVVGCSYLGMPETTQAVRNAFGCNMSFRREILESLGGFRLGYGCDETDFCIRLRQRWPNKKVLYVPQARILHHVPANRARIRRFISRCYFEGGSKAVVTRLVGQSDALASEYRYTRQILPRGVARGVWRFLRRGDTDGLLRAAVIVIGLASTTAGYLVASCSATRAARVRGWSGAELKRERRAQSLVRVSATPGEERSTTTGRVE